MTIKVHYILFNTPLRVVVAALLLPSNLAFAKDQIEIGKAFNQNGKLEYMEHQRLRLDSSRIKCYWPNCQNFSLSLSQFGNPTKFINWHGICYIIKYVLIARSDWVRHLNRRCCCWQVAFGDSPVTSPERIRQAFSGVAPGKSLTWKFSE